MPMKISFYSIPAQIPDLSELLQDKTVFKASIVTVSETLIGYKSKIVGNSVLSASCLDSALISDTKRNWRGLDG